MSDDNKPVTSENDLKELEEQLRAVNPKVFEGLKKEQKQVILSTRGVLMRLCVWRRSAKMRAITAQGNASFGEKTIKIVINSLWLGK